MSSRASFLAELKRRKVFKVGAAYLVVAWLVIQVVATVAPQMQLPDWLPRAVTLILVVGFPIALVLSWLFDATAAGVVRDPVDAANAVTVAGTHTATASQKSIAVLAFADLSPAHDQEYFSDGMAEEILNALAKIKDLKVAGRTSSFYYKGRNEDLRGIGKTLGVANLLEGSVRKQGDRVRITAQLVRSDDGFHLWSETYDGDLTDVFELQDRIAHAIAEKLDLILHGDQRKQLVAVATENPEAYALYLQATSIFNRREGFRIPEAIAQLNEALRLDPKFARGHARLAALYVLATSYRSDGFDANLEASERHARLALELDPLLGEPHAVIGLICGQRRQFADQLAASERALTLDPGDANANYWNALALVCVGYSRRGNALLDHSLAIDPIFSIALLWRGLGHAYAGDMDRAEVLFQRAADVGLGHAGFGLSMVAAARGDLAEAIAQEAAASRFYMHDLPAATPEVFARALYGNSDDRALATAQIDTYLATRPEVIAGIVPMVLIRMGQPARALALAQQHRTHNDPIFLHVLWSPFGRVARSLPEFPEFVRRMGLAALWDRYGAPDMCHKNAAGDYVSHSETDRA